MNKHIDFYFDFISPYSYLAHKKIINLNQRNIFNYKAILLGGLHNLGEVIAPAFNKRKMKNMKNDCILISKKNEIPFKWNEKFPINSLYLMRGFLVIDNNKKNKFIDLCFDAYWKDNLDISIENNIKKILRDCKINYDFFEKSTEQVKNFNYSSKKLDSLEDFLDDIASNIENRPYLDRIYHTTAKHYLKTNKDSIAISYFNKSLQTKSQDLYLNALNYHTIADYYYENSNYTSAGVYYDSTLANYKKRTKPYRAVKKRLDNLKDVILYESIVKVNDSILELISLPENELVSYFESYIKTLKDKSEKTKNKRTKSRRMNINSAGDKKNSKSGSFYFYKWCFSKFR